MTQERLNQEYRGLTEYFQEKTFKFVKFNTDAPALVIAQQTNSGKIYTVEIKLANFPNSVPDAFITNPKPLLTRSRETMLVASHEMHTLSGENGCVKVCHYHPSDWHPNVFLYKVVVKIRIWLEMYETHLKTGRPLSNYLSG